MKDHEGNEIPVADYYVLCFDNFMSGWGMAEGKSNYLVFATNSKSECAKLVEYIHSRSDMRYKGTECEPPNDKLNRPDTYYVQYKSKEEYPMWYAGGKYVSL